METREIAPLLDRRVKIYDRSLNMSTVVDIAEDVDAPARFSVTDIPVEGKEGLMLALDINYSGFPRDEYDVIGMRLYSTDPARTWIINANLLRALRIEDCKNYAVSLVLLRYRPGTPISDFDYMPYNFWNDLHYVAQAREESGSLDLKAFARLYSVATKIMKNPREVLAGGFGVSKPAVAKWAAKARAEGLYTAYTPAEKDRLRAAEIKALNEPILDNE